MTKTKRHDLFNPFINIALKYICLEPFHLKHLIDFVLPNKGLSQINYLRLSSRGVFLKLCISSLRL